MLVEVQFFLSAYLLERAKYSACPYVKGSSPLNAPADNLKSKFLFANKLIAIETAYIYSKTLYSSSNLTHKNCRTNYRLFQGNIEDSGRQNFSISIGFRDRNVEGPADKEYVRK
jgi:hypothetical protein